MEFMYNTDHTYYVTLDCPNFIFPLCNKVDEHLSKIECKFTNLSGQVNVIFREKCSRR
jgi:hypothetical protein